MKSKLLALAILVCLSFTAESQYTPLPHLDQQEYDQFIAMLRTQAAEQQLPELNKIADKMDYDEARRFMLNPHLFADKLKKEHAADDDKPSLDAFRTGLVVNFFLSYISNLDNNAKAAVQFGYALGMYAMLEVAKVYLLAELLYMYRPAGIEFGSSSETLIKVSYIGLITSMLYALPAQNVKWYLGLGPVLSFGLAGREKNTFGNQTNEEDLEFGEDGLNRLQFGICFRVGLMLANSMMLHAGYNLVLSKLFHNSDWRLNSFIFGVLIPFSIFSSTAE